MNCGNRTARGGVGSWRKNRLRDLWDEFAPERHRWVEKNKFFYDEDLRFLRFLIPPNLSVLDLGCADGRLLSALAPKRGVGVDFSPTMIELARARHPEFEFHVGDIEDPEGLAGIKGPFEVILMSDTIGSLDDVQSTLERLHPLCTRDTRIVISYYNRLWAPILYVAQRVGQQMPLPEQNWLPADDIAALMSLADFETVRIDRRQLLPRRLVGVGRVVNRFLGTLPFLRRLALRSYVVSRSLRSAPMSAPSVTIVIPCRNEAGNVAAAVDRLPRFAPDMEILFVEGHSSDGTYQAIEEVIAAYPDLDIKLVRQDGVGKGDAVRKGFDMARGEVLMILDADLTVPPEDLPKFYNAVTKGRGELVMGSRLVYPMEDDAMRVLNSAGNRAFSWLFSWLLNQRITDTLCGTKVMTRDHWERIKESREYFGDFDPFGDFDMIFGAAKANLRILEVPVRYRAREYGETQIDRFRHGWLLVKMVATAYMKLKAV